MSEQKKPKATFGDVMLGIPSGARDDKDAPSTSDKPQERKGGPMVVVKRAGGAVETRKLQPTGADNGHRGGEEHKAEVVTPTPVVTPIGPSVADDVHEHESFAEMFEKHARGGGLPARKHPRVGEKLKGKIFQLGAETAFVTVGKHEAMIELDELKDDEGILRFGIGDEIEAHVVQTGAKGIVLSRKLAKDAASLSVLAEARGSGMPVEGIVLGVNKGGLEVAVGEVRAFCPTSQIDVRPTHKPDELVGQRLTFRVTEVKERNVVLSRRAILEEGHKERAAELRKTLEVGKVMRGEVVGTQTFGAFVDLGGIEGLIPISELSHARLHHANEVVKVGDVVEVELIRLEAADPQSPDKSKRKERVTLSMRARMEDPFTKAMNELKDGMIVKGKVVRLQPFGAFVELFPGVDGLIHISAMSERRIAHPKDVLKVGEEIQVKVEKLDPGEKRIGLRLVKDGVAVGEHAAPVVYDVHEPVEARPAKVQAPKPRRGQVVTGKVVRIEQYGIFIEWDSFSGLVPASETGTERGTDLKRIFPMGTMVKAEVIELERDRVKLSIIAAAKTEERADLDAWKATQSKVEKSAGGFNSMAAKLKGLNLKLS